jgi:nucleoid DNA-binding protein
MRALKELVRQAANRIDVPTDLAWGIVQETIEEIARSLDAGQGVRIKGLGTWRWKLIAQCKSKTWSGKGFVVPSGWKLRFLPAKRFRSRRIKMSEKQEEGMTKLGVQLDDQKTKTASTDGKSRTCPLCQRTLDDFGACPEHGTEPFEQTKR